MRHHPKALRYFFLTEAWERFGFYTIQTILVLYMVSALKFGDDHAYLITGEFTALAYILPLLGGYLADRLIGYRFSILLGGIFLCLGYACLGLWPDSLFIGLSLVVLGNGLFKPNISSFLGEFYTKNDSRRDSGFTLFYIGINIGALLAPVTGGFTQEYFGWYVSFAVASVGLLIGTLIFRASYASLEGKGFSPRYPEIQKLHELFLKKPQLILFLLAVAATIFLLFHFPDVTKHLLNVMGGVILLGLVFLTMKHQGADRKHLVVMIIMLLFSIIFWALLFEMYFSVNLFTERAVDRTIFGFNIPAAVFIGLESTLILLLGPLFALVWQRINPQRHFLTIPYKFSYGLLFAALSYELLAVLVNHTAPGVSLHPAWMILFYLLLVVAELFLSPIGLSMITALSPTRYVGLMMGVWFITLGYGGALSGFLAKDASVAVATQTLAEQMHTYKNAFQHFANVGFVAFAILFFLAPWLTRWMNSVSRKKAT